MLENIRGNKSVQLALGLLIGIAFGFLLQKGGATEYGVIIGQLRLVDNTVVKIMLSAVVTGMLGVYLLKGMGVVQLHIKPGSVGTSVVGGLIFGVAFAVLGYCPGTVAGAVGGGSLDALIGGVVGMLVGSGLFAASYGKLKKPVLNRGDWGQLTLPELLKVNEWVVVLSVAALIVALLWWLESSGF